MRKSQKILGAICALLGVGILSWIGFRAVHAAEPSEMDYYAYADDLGLIEVINSTDLTMDMLEARNGKLIIEQCVGVVTDAETGAGYIVGYPEFYISYKSVDGVKNGDVICTYFIYNPDTDFADDILLRFDYIIDVLE